MPDKKRRKSFGMFSALTPSQSSSSSSHQSYKNDPTSPQDGPTSTFSFSSHPAALAQPKTLKKKSRPNSLFVSKSRPVSPGPHLAETTSSQREKSLEMPRSRPKALQKAARHSVFGSLMSLPSSDEDNRTPSVSKTPSIDEEEVPPTPYREGTLLGSAVLHRGEVQTSGGMFRKRNNYMVLTDTNLVRFKSQAKAAEMFPSIPAALSRSSTSRASLTASVTSFQELQAAAYTDITSGIPLNQIISICRLDDGRPYFSLEVSHLDERSRRAACMHMQLNDPREADSWLAAIRSAARKARAKELVPFEQETVDYVARALDKELDYYPDHFHMFKAVQRSSNKTTRTSNDDLSKLSSTICYLAIGLRKIHILPVRLPSNRSSSTSLNELDSATSFGITTLTAFSMQTQEDSLRMTFRVPLKNSFTIHLGSAFGAEIALWIRSAAEFLRPRWINQPFQFTVPSDIEDESIILDELEEDHGCFDRTLTAYCAGYDVLASNIRYAIDYDCEDAPCFRLFPPATPGQKNYMINELLAVLRSLRYNESITSISFNGISLDSLHKVHDIPGADPDALRTRSGLGNNIEGQDKLSLLSSEIRALAAKSKRLRRFDFSACINRTPSTNPDVRDIGCGIPEAIFPLCRRQITNVDWVILNGIKLSETDMDYLVDAAAQKQCHLRALEISNCGLSVHDLDLVLSTIKAQENTLEVIDVSGVQGRLSPEVFQQQIGYFGQIRRINLSRVSRTSGPEPLIAPETLLTWRLQSLSLSSTQVNEKTVDSIAAYLASDRSETLRELHLDQCGLTGRDAAVFMQSMVRDDGRPRNLHLHISENRLDDHYEKLFRTIAQSKTPTHVSMRMIDFKKEDHFRELIKALQKNKSLKYLDISKASLPYDAGKETCEELQVLFEQNHTLEELDISGEYAHLEQTRFGIGLNLALTGLKKNKTLRVLKIEHQKLGLQGASTLASVLEDNTALCEVYCDNNDINLQGFTVLLNGLQKNESILYLPSMDRDREQSLEKVRREIQSINKESAKDEHHQHHHGHNLHHGTGSSLRRTFTSSFTSSSSAKAARAAAAAQVPQRHSSAPAYTDQDVKAVLRSLNEKWDAEILRLGRYLERNASILEGAYISSPGDSLPGLSSESAGKGQSFSSESDISRPGTANSLSAYLDASRIDRTPTLERSLDFGTYADPIDPSTAAAATSTGTIPQPAFAVGGGSGTDTDGGAGGADIGYTYAGYNLRSADCLGNIFEESFEEPFASQLAKGGGLGQYGRSPPPRIDWRLPQ